jgi:hypothetical protein
MARYAHRSNGDVANITTYHPAARPTAEWTYVKAEQGWQGRRFDQDLGQCFFEEGLSFVFVPSSLRRNPNPPQYPPLDIYQGDRG